MPLLILCLFFPYRIAVVHFPYSDPETIPAILPIHIRNDPSKLPEDFNTLLCQLLEVRKRELFSFIPIPIVRPKVSTFKIICKFMVFSSPVITGELSILYWSISLK